ncbi:MAG: glutamate formimidoyltransferase [Bacteroidota bacterium]
MKPLIECVPNFSEGKDEKVLNAIADAISSIKRTSLLNIDKGTAANRTVFTFAGDPESVLESAFQAIKVASELIDMRKHIGEHPRMGATDVCPFVPIQGIDESYLLNLVEEFAERVGTELKIPVYLYEKSANTESRKNLANIRSGEYEGFKTKITEPKWVPDYGPTQFNEKTGATAIGVRKFLIAYNVNLHTDYVEIADRIAKKIRTSGQLIVDGQGTKKRIPGKFEHLKAIGWYIDDFKCAQVSMNFTDFEVTPIHSVFEEIKALAEKEGVEVNGSELVGLITKKALLEAGKYYLNKQVRNEDEVIGEAVEKLGLNSVKAFRIEKQVVESLLR